MSIEFRGRSDTLIDDPLDVRLVGCQPGAAVELRSEVEFNGMRYEGSQTVMASNDGSCEVPPTLITMAARTEEAAREPGHPSDPLCCHISVTTSPDIHIDLVRRFRAEDVTIEELDDGVYGRLYLPPGDGPHPAVILMTGSGGGIDDQKAALLASRGYACLALAYFNFPGCPDELMQIPLECFDQAHHYLASHPRIDGDRVAVDGRSRGGELTIQLAAMFDWVHAAIAMVPAAHRWAGFTRDGQTGAPWTWQGEDLPYLPSDDADDAAVQVIDDAVLMAPAADAALARLTAGQLEAARLPAEQVDCPVLLISGDDDGLWPSTLFATQVYDTLRAARPNGDHTNLVLPDGGHHIPPPGQPVETALPHPTLGMKLILGGTPAGNAEGRELAWTTYLDFLGRTIRA